MRRGKVRAREERRKGGSDGWVRLGKGEKREEERRGKVRKQGKK